MSEKKINRSILGPRGRRRLGLSKGENYKGPGGDRGGYVGSQRKAQEMVEEQGFGIFPQGWLGRCNFKPKEKNLAKFVLPSLEVNTWETAKLATPSKVDTLPTYTCFNPFTEPMPEGDGKPLPR